MYFSKEWTEGITLPDGSIATSGRQLDNYMREHNVSLKQDYSDHYLKNVRRRNEKAQKDEFFSDFIHNYKRSIWK